MMSYMMITVAAAVSIAIWLLVLYREFATSKEQIRKTAAAKKLKMRRVGQPVDDGNQVKSRQKARGFGHR